MANHPSFEFTVQVFHHDKNNKISLLPGAHAVVACSAEKAASRVLREELHSIGDVSEVRARVWRLGPDGQPITSMLYRRL